MGLINSPTKLIWPSALKSTAVLQDWFGYRRSHALVALCCGDLFRVAVYDRSGSGVTPDITEDLDRFLRCVIGFLSEEESRLGLHSDAAANTFTATLNNPEFVVERAPICVAPYDHLIFRGTSCWRASWSPGHRPEGLPDVSTDPWPLLLKAAWQYDTRPLN
jgi:hypothetical protein